MPTPASQRLELLCVLRKARELRCLDGLGEDENDGVGVGVSMKEGEEGALDSINAHTMKLERRLDLGKRHLEWLVLMVSQVGRLARHDKEIADACMGVMDAAVGLA